MAIPPPRDRIECRPDSAASSTCSRKGSSYGGRQGGIVTAHKEVDFGYVKLGEARVVIFKAKNANPFAINCHFSLKSAVKAEKENSRRRAADYKILDCTEAFVPANTNFEVRIQFKPGALASFYDKLNIQVTGGATSHSYGINLSGVGGVANVLPIPKDELFSHRSGDFVLHAASRSMVSLGLKNAGERYAYVRVAIVDREGRKVEGAVIKPSHSFVVPAGGKMALIVDVSKVVMEDGRSRSSSCIDNNGGIGSRRSSTLSLNSLASSASSLTRSAAYQILLYWGEETQRKRMVCACQSLKYGSCPPLCPVEEDFSLPFLDETAFVAPREKPVKKNDIEMFISAIRAHRINVVWAMGSSRLSNAVQDDSYEDRTLVPDGSFTNDTVVSMAADLTVMRSIR